MENDIVEILLIEDYMNDAELTIHALRKGNINNILIHLKDGAEALEFLFGTGKFEGSDIGNKPKVIPLGLKMPKLDGLEVLMHIRQTKTNKNNSCSSTHVIQRASSY